MKHNETIISIGIMFRKDENLVILEKQSSVLK